MPFSGLALQLQVTFVLSTGNCTRDDCLCQSGTEERQKKPFELGSKDCLPSQKFLKEGKLVGGGGSAACVVSYRCLIFGIMQEYYRRLLVLPDTSIYCTFSSTCIVSLIASKCRLLFHL